MTRVVVLDHTAVPSGAQLNLRPMSDHMPESPTFLLLEDGPIAQGLREGGAEVRVEELNREIGSKLIGRRDWRTARTVTQVAGKLRTALTATCREVGAKVVLVNSLRALLLLSIWGPPEGTKVIVLLRDIVARPYMSYSEVLATRAAFQRVADLVVANSAATMRSARFDRATVLPPFIDAMFFEGAGNLKIASSDELQILLLGRLSPWKGQQFALEALADTGHQLRVAGGSWFGESDYAMSVRNLAEKMSNVELLGHRSDVLDLIDDSDVVLHSSTLPEPFGQVIIQGMARRRIVVASAAGGPAETIAHEYDGLLYEPGDAADLRSKIASIDQDRSVRIGEAAYLSSRSYHPARTAYRLAHLVHRVGRQV